MFIFAHILSFRNPEKTSLKWQKIAKMAKTAKMARMKLLSSSFNRNIAAKLMAINLLFFLLTLTV